MQSKLPDVGTTIFTVMSKMAQEKGVAAIPLAPFYETPPANKIFRFCFCKDDATLEQAAAILCKL